MPDADDWPHIFGLPETDKWRVKLCRLRDESWDVFGEGMIYGKFDEAANTYSLIVEDTEHAEDDGEPPLVWFRTIIQPPIAFQKQDTVLLWNGPNEDIHSKFRDLVDTKSDSGLSRIAIGFQAATGCASISEFILYAASHIPEEDEIAFTVQHVGGSDSTFDGLVEFIEQPPVLPPMPTKLNLTIVLNDISELLGSVLGREFLVVYLDARQYLERVWDVFDQITTDRLLESRVPARAELSITENGAGAPISISGSQEGKHEDFQNGSAATHNTSRTSPIEKIQILWAISDIVKQYCLLGDSYLIEQILDADNFMKVLSMLEYDRAFGTRKANFKDYYLNHTDMKQVFEIDDIPVVEKIQRTFRLQLLRDVLVRSADDFTFHILRTLIYVNQSEIVDKLQNSPKFCSGLFGLFEERPNLPANETTQTKNDAIDFIYDIIKTSKTFAFSQLKPLYLSLLNNGLVKAVSYALDNERADSIKLKALESLSILLEFDVSLILPFRDSLVKSMMNLAIEHKGENEPSSVSSSPRGAASSASSSGKPPSYSSSLSLMQTSSFRGVLIEIAEILKRMLLDLPAETMQCFFSQVHTVFAKERPNSMKKSVTLLTLLDIFTHCFSCHPEITGALMKEYGIWEQIVEYCKSAEADQARDHFYSQRSMALIRLVRETIQPLGGASTLECADNAHCIIDSGLFAYIVKHHVRNYLQRNHANDAEQSSFLNLLYTIVERRSNTTAMQFRILADWMANEGVADTKLLCEKYKFVANLLPDSDESGAVRASLLKRLPNTQLVSSGGISHQAQRVKVDSPGPGRQYIDEVDDDVFVLPPSSFTNHFSHPGSEDTLHDEPQEHQQKPTSLNERDAAEPAEARATTSNGSPADVIRSNSPFHPWWKSTKGGREAKPSEDSNEKVMLIHQRILAESLNGNQH